MSQPTNVDTVNIVTACSRPSNLYRIGLSILESLSRSSLKVTWTIIVDKPLAFGDLPLGDHSRVIPEVILSTAGPSKFGILQKNVGIDRMENGYYHCLDDDNIVHPRFFMAIHQAMVDNPTKWAFVFGQERFDIHGSFMPSPDRMVPTKIDNTMFVVHKSVIGDSRYDLSKAGFEDGYFFQGLYQRHKEKFAFIQEQVTYYNYLRHFA